MRFTHTPVVHIGVSLLLFLALIAGFYLETGSSLKLIVKTIFPLAVYIFVVGLTSVSVVEITDTDILLSKRATRAVSMREYAHVYAVFLVDFYHHTRAAPTMLVFRKQKTRVPSFLLKAIDSMLPSFGEKRVVYFHQWKDDTGSTIPSPQLFRKIVDRMPPSLKNQIRFPSIPWV